MGIRFVSGQGELTIYHPNGTRFLTSIELNQRAEQAEAVLNQERQQVDRLAAYLRSIGVDPDRLP